MTAEEKYRTALEEILFQMMYNPKMATIPGWFNQVVANILLKCDIEVALNDPQELFGIKLTKP